MCQGKKQPETISGSEVFVIFATKLALVTPAHIKTVISSEKSHKFCILKVIILISSIFSVTNKTVLGNADAEVIAFHVITL